jgi:serine/threonine-protein kinase
MLVAGHGANCDPKWDGAETLLLRGLAPAVVDKLLDGAPAARGLMPIDEDVSPLYVEQLMRFVTDGGTTAPPGLADLIAARIHLLAGDARRLLQAIAVVGDAAPAAQIVALVPELVDMRRHLQTLRRCGWIEMDDDCVSVGHPLVRAVAMATTPVAVRRQLHSRARHDCGLDTLQIPLEAHALHARHGTEPFEALVLLEQCALRAGARDDDDGRVSALRQGRDLARAELRGGVLDNPIDAVVMFSCKLGDALAAIGMHAEATKVLEETIADVSPSDVLRPRVLAAMASVANASGMTGEADSLLREALSLARQHDDALMTHSLERMNASWQELSP